MNLELTDDEAAALLRELNGIIDSDRYFCSTRIKTLRAIRAKIRPEPVREPSPPPPKRYESPRASAPQRLRRGR
jgi:hypothetical protein